MADSEVKDKKSRGAKISDGFSNFAKFLFNKDTGQVMGRSGRSWLKIGIFYVIFYSFLAGFFAALLTVFLTTLNDPGKGGPKLIQFLENKPGLTLLESLDLDYNRSDTNFVKNHTAKIRAFLKRYDDPANGKTKCNIDDKNGMPEDTSCRFDTSWLGACDYNQNKTTDFGYGEGVPCIYVRINRIYGWVPKGPSSEPNFLVLKCNNPDVQVIPKGFAIAAFPFRGQKSPFQLPVVAVKFNVTKIDEVKCWLVGKGIQVSESYIPHRAYANIKIS